MAKTTKSQSKSSRKPIRGAAPEVSPEPSAPRPGGKLGLIIERVAATAGATAEELGEATGWQRHSVLGALSQLRTRGFAVTLHTTADRRAYRLGQSKG